MLKRIASALKIDIKNLLAAEDFNDEVCDINKDELNENHLKEKNYIKNVTISIFFNITIILIPIMHIILNYLYKLKNGYINVTNA